MNMEYMVEEKKGVKTVRITDELHSELVKIAGQMAAKTGEMPAFEKVIKELVDHYKKSK